MFLLRNKFVIYEPKHNHDSSLKFAKKKCNYRLLLLSLRHWSPDLTSNRTYECGLFFSWPPACDSLWLGRFRINMAYYSHSCHLVFHESTISWYWELERLIIHNGGKCCAFSFPVTLSPISPLPCFQFSSTARISSECWIKEEGTQSS